MIFRYLAERNKHGASYPGVPLRDLTQQDIDRLASHVLASVEQSDFYERVATVTAVVEEPVIEPEPVQPLAEASADEEE